MKRSLRLSIASLAVFACLLSMSGLAGAQTTVLKDSDHSELRERIANIIRETIKRGEGSVEFAGQKVKTVTFMPPSNEHVEEIRRYGKDAIPTLAQYLRSGSGFEKYLAMRFLGQIGGDSVVEPLRQVALEDSSPGIRIAALQWLTQTRWEFAAPIIRRAAEKDSSMEVRETAQELLVRAARDSERTPHN